MTGRMAWVERQICRTSFEHRKHRAQHLVRSLQAYGYQRAFANSRAPQMLRQPVAVLVELLVGPLHSFADHGNPERRLRGTPFDGPVDRLEGTEVHGSTIPIVDYQPALAFFENIQILHILSRIRRDPAQDLRIRGQPPL